MNKANNKVAVKFTTRAWYKILALVASFDTEIAWHGIAKRGDYEYIIDDIVVYPQCVNGCTVTTDQNEYTWWMMEQPDTIFNSIRLQGHSHVHMDTMPSTTDRDLYDRLIYQIDQSDEFYLFMIINKHGEIYCEVHDAKMQIHTENCDIFLQSETKDFKIHRTTFMRSALGLLFDTRLLNEIKHFVRSARDLVKEESKVQNKNAELLPSGFSQRPDVFLDDFLQ